MPTYHFNSGSNGLLLRPPTLRVYHSRVEAKQAGDNPSWRSEIAKPHWQPIGLRWVGGGGLSTLKLRVQLGSGPGKTNRRRPEDDVACPGDRIRLVQVGEGFGPGRTSTLEWFTGYVAKQEILIAADPDVEDLSITAFGPELLLRNKIITGQWHKKPAADDAEISNQLSEQNSLRSEVFQTYLPAVFNEDGKPNASTSNWKLTDKDIAPGDNQCKTFESPTRKAGGVEAVYWNAYTALRSLIEWVDNYGVISFSATNWPALAASLAGVELGTVNVMGMNLLEAIRAVLEPVGFAFAVEPWSGDANNYSSGHRLIVYPLGRPTRLAQVYMAPVHKGNVKADSFEGRLSQVQRLEFARDQHEVANDIVVIGDRRRTQVTLEFDNISETRDLHPLWDTSTNNLANYISSNNRLGGCDWKNASAAESFQSNFGQWRQSNYHVFRSFAWNEDGALSAIIPTLPNLQNYGIDGSYVRRRRPVGATFTYDDSSTQSRRLPARVELGIVGDSDAWIRIPGTIIWEDRAGFTLACSELADWFPYSAPGVSQSLTNSYGHLSYLTLLYSALSSYGTKLRLRLTGSIESDQAITGCAQRQLSNSWPFTARRMVFMPDRFKIRDVAGVVSSDTHTIDDSPEAETFAAALHESCSNAQAHGTVVLRGLYRGYQIGDGIDRIMGRGIDLSLDSATGQTGAVAAIRQVSWNFEQGGVQTKLALNA